MDGPDDAYWYFRTFTLPGQPPPRTRYYLRLGAVRQSSDVWLNGKHLGSHGGGEDPFEFDVTALLQTAQPNALAVRVKMHRLGGVRQSVKLVAQPGVRIIDSFARPDATAKKIDLEVTLENNTGSPATVEVAAELGSFKPAAGLGRLATTVTAAPGISTARIVLPVAQPHIWNLDDPFLYTIKVTSMWKDARTSFITKGISTTGWPCQKKAPETRIGNGSATRTAWRRAATPFSPACRRG